MIIGDFGAAAVLISFGIILGKCNLHQLTMLALLEIVFYSLNEAICVTQYGATDMGGTMYVHTFGAYFGLGATHWFWMQKNKKEEKKDATAFLASHNSKLLAMGGTLFLWMFWPSFNGALGVGRN